MGVGGENVGCEEGGEEAGERDGADARADYGGRIPCEGGRGAGGGGEI